MTHSEKSKLKQKANSPHKIIFDAIGTRWVIDIYNLPQALKDTINSIIFKRIEEFDKTYSRFRGDSLIRKIATLDGEYLLPQDARLMLDLYKKLYRLTDGLFTPLIGNLLEEAGYDAQYSLVSEQLHHPPKWEDVLEFEKTQLIVKTPVILDFGAAGKGYLIDLVGKLLEDHKIDSYCIDGGGDILYKCGSQEELSIGLEHPDNFNQVIGVAKIANQSICGSATNRRKWQGFNHIINPHTLKSVDKIMAVWVIADTAILADALSTCLFLVNPEKLTDKFKFEYLVVYADYSIQKSTDFPAEIYYT